MYSVTLKKEGISIELVGDDFEHIYEAYVEAIENDEELEPQWVSLRGTEVNNP